MDVTLKLMSIQLGCKNGCYIKLDEYTVRV